MTKINNMLKENYDLKQELQSMVSLVKENEAKYQGFKVVGFSFLLSDNLLEFSDKPLKYLEDIFNITRAIIYIKDGAYAITNSMVDIGERVKVRSASAFRYTFLEKRIYSGKSKQSLHPDFDFMKDSDYSYILAPIADNGEIIGALAIYSLDETRFTLEDNFDFVNELTFYASVSIKKLNNTFLLEMQAQTDYLTCLPNKSMLEISSTRWLKRLDDDKEPFIFMLLDLDNFKLANDQLGHIEGDNLLRAITRAVRGIISSGDILGRFGGDEFYLFFSIDNDMKFNVFKSSLKKVCSRISADFNLTHALGVSVGYVEIKPDSARSFSEILNIADKLLYTVKLSGKDSFLGE